MNTTFYCIQVCSIAYLMWGLITVYALIFEAGVKLSWITNFHGFWVFIFVVCDVIAQALPVWSKFSQDETFADGY